MGRGENNKIRNTKFLITFNQNNRIFVTVTASEFKVTKNILTTDYFDK